MLWFVPSTWVLLKLHLSVLLVVLLPLVMFLLLVLMMLKKKLSLLRTAVVDAAALPVMR